MVLSISRFELLKLFSTPVAWILLAIFSAQCAWGFSAAFEEALRAQVLRDPNGPLLDISLFTSRFTGILSRINQFAFLYTPLITMGIVSRELETGHISLTLSSPATPRQMVWGKYIALAAFYSLFFLVLVLCIVFTSLYVGQVDWPAWIVGALSFYALLLTYAAIGLFISTLTRRQLVAAVVTFGVLGVLVYIGFLGQSFPLLSGINYWLEITSRMDYLGRGLLISSDVLYFVALSWMFILLAEFRYRSLSGGVRPNGASLSLSIQFVAAILLAVISDIPQARFYYDATRYNTNSLSPEGKAIMSHVQGPWSVVVYANAADDTASLYLPSRRKWRERIVFDSFRAVNPDFSKRYEFFFAPPPGSRMTDHDAYLVAEKFAADNDLDFPSFLTYDEAVAQAGLELPRMNAGYVLETKDGKALVRTFDDPLQRPMEAELLAGFRSISRGTMLLGYVAGDGRRSAFSKGPRSHRLLVSERRSRRSLINNGYQVVEIGLDAPVPPDIDILVLAGSVGLLTAEQAAYLTDYLEDGRSAVFLLEDVGGELLEDVLGAVGLRVKFRLPHHNDRQARRFEPLALTDNARAIGIPNLVIERKRPVVSIDPLAIEIDASGDLSVFRFLSFARTEDEQLEAPLSAGIALSRSKSGHEQRLVIVGDADFAVPGVISARDFAANANSIVFSKIFSWASGGVYPVDTSRPEREEFVIKADMRLIDNFRLSAAIVLPVGFFLFGMVKLRAREAM